MRKLIPRYANYERNEWIFNDKMCYFKLFFCTFEYSLKFLNGGHSIYKIELILSFISTSFVILTTHFLALRLKIFQYIRFALMWRFSLSLANGDNLTHITHCILMTLSEDLQNDCHVQMVFLCARISPKILKFQE